MGQIMNKELASFQVIGLLFLHHLLAHLVAATIDPAVQNVRPKAKHCKPSACNKCISDFDDHCK
ncbi:LOW QUALITY PROTEIN: palmitoyltransferase ZDHHC11 [Spheniscus humboldti]